MLYIHSHHAYIAADNATVAQGKRRQQIPPLRNLLTLLSSFSYIYIFIRINCSFKNKKLKKNKGQRDTQRVKCILTKHSGSAIGNG